jgi:selenocysteine lyase/cysteine desulfurase
MHAIRAYELELYRHLAARLAAIDGIEIVGLTAGEDMERRTPTAAIKVAGVTPHAAAEHLGQRGIAVWDGDFYATGLIERLGLAPDGVVRIGLTHYNTSAEVDRLADELAALVESARRSAVEPAAAS